MFVQVFTVLTKHEKCLMTFLDAILKDPTMDWAVDRTKRAFHQNLELKLQLNRLLARLDLQCIQDHFATMQNLQKSIKSLLDGFNKYKQEMKDQQSLQKKISDAENLLSDACCQETKAFSKLQGQKLLHGKKLTELEAMRGTVEHIIKLNHNWCYRHGRLLMALFDQSDELLLLSQEKWNSAFASQALDFIHPSSQLTILGLLFGEHSPSSFLPQELVDECLAIDQQRALEDNAKRDTS